MGNENLFNHDHLRPIVQSKTILTKMDMLERVNEAALACNRLFDLIEEEGPEAPLNNIEGLKVLAAVLQPIEDMRSYYNRRNIQRMLALGISPETLMNMERKQ